MTTAFRLFFAAPDGVKQQCEPWNTEELPREFGFIGNMETKEQWFGTRHHCAREPAADGPTGWPADDALAGCASFRAAVLEAMALYDRVCRLVLGLVAPALLEECGDVPPDSSHSGILDAFAYFNNQPTPAAGAAHQTLALEERAHADSEARCRCRRGGGGGGG